MSFIAKVAVPFAALLTAALAIQNVTVVPLTNGCADYPGYDASTGLSANFLVTLNSCDNSTVNGNGDTCQVIRHAGDTGIVEGRISIAADDTLAKTAFQCNDALGPGILEALVPSGVSGYSWSQVNITYLPWDAELGWGFGQYSIPVQAYSLFDEETGDQLDGVFLGNSGYATWAVKWYPADSGSIDGNPYWGLRLLGANSNISATAELYPEEYRTFLQVSA